jgi:hypothetical protein
MAVTGIPIISGFNLDNNQLIDKRSGPYDSKTEALTELTAGKRAVGLVVYVAVGNIVRDNAGNLVSCDKLDTYVFEKGLTDADLVLMGKTTLTKNFQMLVTSPFAPVLKNVTGGTITIDDNGNGTYLVYSDDNITHFELDYNADSDKITSIIVQKGDTLTSLDYTFFLCSKMTNFEWNGPCNATTMKSAWRSCEVLFEFPYIDTSKVTRFDYAWQNCHSLKSFPELDTGKGTYFIGTWYGNGHLENFPELDFTSATNFYYTWANCSKLNFITLGFTPHLTNVSQAWSNCNNLICINKLDFNLVTDLLNTFNGCSNLINPAPTGTPVRDGDNALAGTWTNPTPCDSVVIKKLYENNTDTNAFTDA